VHDAVGIDQNFTSMRGMPRSSAECLQIKACQAAVFGEFTLALQNVDRNVGLSVDRVV
jgi:hypothetical protein